MSCPSRLQMLCPYLFTLFDIQYEYMIVCQLVLQTLVSHVAPGHVMRQPHLRLQQSVSALGPRGNYLLI